MMKRWFITIFVIFLIFVFFYQKKYLANLRSEALRISSEVTDPSKTIVGTGYEFKTFFYDKNGLLNAELSGDKITYYEDSTFQATGNLIYKAFDTNKSSVNTIKTNTAIGVFESDDQNKFLLSGNRQLKSLELPENVSFNFNGNQGTTKNVFIDAIDRTISSDEHIESQGPDGKFSANGFFYDIDTKDFTFNSKVRGIYKKNQRKKK